MLSDVSNIIVVVLAIVAVVVGVIVVVSTIVIATIVIVVRILILIVLVTVAVHSTIQQQAKEATDPQLPSTSLMNRYHIQGEDGGR